MNKLTPKQFEEVLDEVVRQLSRDLVASNIYHDPDRFEQHVRDTLGHACHEAGLKPAPGQHRFSFPDVTLNGFGVEIKFTKNDTWVAVGNSVFESMRTEGITQVYVIFGKAGGEPEVRWEHYENCVRHVRVSHAPRFVIEMEGDRDPLFKIMGIEYDGFRQLSNIEKMEYLRKYSRQHLREGERLWWIEEPKSPHALPMQVRLYMKLTQEEKRKFRAEAAIIAPQICKGSRSRGKYIDASLYLLTQHGVFCPQARDLFSAGSVALRNDSRRGGNYILRALKDIEGLMREASMKLDSKIFIEYWGKDCPPEKRIKEWLRLADGYASDWRPSEHLFLDD